MKPRKDDDYSLQGMESRMRKSKGAPLTETERAWIKEQADKIAEAEKAYEAAKEAEEIAKENAEVDRLIAIRVKETEGDKSEDGEKKLNPFLVGLCTIILLPIFLPAAWLHEKTKLSLFVAGLFSTVAILILLFLAGYGISRLLH
jgi:hypothetical protein